MENTVNFFSPEVIAAIVSVSGAFVSGIGGFCVWKYKKNVQKAIDKELEVHKSELDNKKIEIQNLFDNQLERLRVEYGSLYGKRVAAIENLYSLLYDIRLIRKDIAEHLHHYHEEEGSWPDSMKEMVDSLLEKLSKFEELFDRSKIYFPINTIEKLKKYIKLIGSFRDQYDFYKQEHDGDIEGFMLGAYSTLFPANFEDILTDLENDFRVLIGERN